MKNILLNSILIFILIIILINYSLYSKSENYDNIFNKKIFIFWDKGWDNAPYLCQVCLKSWEYFNKNWTIIKLDKNNINNYLDQNILSLILKKKLVQHQADLIRVNLLNKYGGVWVDATTFCNKPLDEWLFKYMNNGFFCFKFNKESGLHHYRLSNWFLACNKNSYIIKEFTKKYNKHWQNKTKDQYFGFHFLFDNLCNTDDKFNNDFKTIGFFDARKIRVQEPSFNNNIDFNLVKPANKDIKKIIANNKIPLYKFSWQKNTDENYNSNSTINYIVKKKLGDNILNQYFI